LNTLFIGQHLLRYKEVDSTNRFLHDLSAKSKPSEGTVVLADFQTAGVGQYGSTWSSRPGENLLFSVILYPPAPLAARPFTLIQLAATAIADVLRDAQLPVAIKWPNDIYVNDQKLAGILTQTAWSGNAMRHAIIGVGMNVNQGEFPPEIKGATSLRKLTGQAYDRDALLSEILGRMEARYLTARGGDLKTLEADYAQYLYRKGIPAQFEDKAGRQFEGIIQGVNFEGHLVVLETTTGREWAFGLKEIRFI
jgi:BirA family biotin operon repressor/biotin-[acetyl-CoA-carboxylase] ligase